MAADRRRSNSDDIGLVSGPSKRRRTPFWYIVLSLFVTLLGVGVTVAGLFLFGQRQLEAAGPLTTTKVVAIKSGQRSFEIAALLETEGVISSQRIFYVAAAIYQQLGRSLKAGEYRFDPGASMQAVFDQISKGKALAYKITIPEGWTSTQALERIRDHAALTGNAPETLGEGVLLPDTYTFQRGDTRQSLIDRMRQAQAKLLKDLWPSRAADLPVTSVEEALILASIVEKETGVATERARVAGVFVNRLKKNMRLQSDPTIIYGIVGGKGKLGRPIRRSEIEAKTAYNTYQIKGLPPTPISNPGKHAILAVLQPAQTDELYFVADGTGGHVFARTLAEHQVNVKRYRKIERERKIAAAAAAEQSEQRDQSGQATSQAKVEDNKVADIPSETTEPSKAEAASTTTAIGEQDKSEEDPDTKTLPVATNASSQAEAAARGEIAQPTNQPVPLPRRKPAIN